MLQVACGKCEFVFQLSKKEKLVLVDLLIPKSHVYTVDRGHHRCIFKQGYTYIILCTHK